MHWRQAGTGLFALMVLTGCPSEFGKDGRVNKAARKDSLELVKKHCSQKKYDEFCGGNKKHTQACSDECGG
jgi:hypothetical protein